MYQLTIKAKLTDLGGIEFDLWPCESDGLRSVECSNAPWVGSCVGSSKKLSLCLAGGTERPCDRVADGNRDWSVSICGRTGEAYPYVTGALLLSVSNAARSRLFFFFLTAALDMRGTRWDGGSDGPVRASTGGGEGAKTNNFYDSVKLHIGHIATNLHKTDTVNHNYINSSAAILLTEVKIYFYRLNINFVTCKWCKYFV